MNLNDLQKGLRAAVKSALPEIEVFDSAPSNIAMPYITFGEINQIRNDTKDIRYAMYDVVLHIWTTGPGRVQAQEILNTLRLALDNTRLNLQSSTPAVYFVSNIVLSDPDGVTQHGVLRLEIRE